MTRFHPRTPVILLTGFLGAGKTTLLTKWLQEASAAGLRIGVVMNEFGDVSVDSALAATPSVPMEQVSSGCLCCAEDGQLADSLQRLLTERACDLIIIETSGLAEPCSIIGILTEPEMLPLVQLHAVFTVVDAQNYELRGLSSEERDLADRQISYANHTGASRHPVVPRLPPYGPQRLRTLPKPTECVVSAMILAFIEPYCFLRTPRSCGSSAPTQR